MGKIKKGDIVVGFDFSKIDRKQNAGWNPSMSKLVGKEGVVLFVDGVTELSNVCVQFPGYGNWYYPNWSEYLKPVNKVKENLKTLLKDD